MAEAGYREVEMMWSNKKPTAPGWWWYQDSEYGPSPVFVAWVGFIELQEARNLYVDMCVGEEQELAGISVADLDGEWHPLDVPNTQHPE